MNKIIDFLKQKTTKAGIYVALEQCQIPGTAEEWAKRKATFAKTRAALARCDEETQYTAYFAWRYADVKRYEALGSEIAKEYQQFYANELLESFNKRYKLTA